MRQVQSATSDVNTEFPSAQEFWRGDPPAGLWLLQLERLILCAGEHYVLGGTAQVHAKIFDAVQCECRS